MMCGQSLFIIIHDILFEQKKTSQNIISSDVYVNHIRKIGCVAVI